jgi:hypothetical protein
MLRVAGLNFPSARAMRVISRRGEHLLQPVQNPAREASHHASLRGTRELTPAPEEAMITPPRSQDRLFALSHRVTFCQGLVLLLGGSDPPPVTGHGFLARPCATQSRGILQGVGETVAVE